MADIFISYAREDRQRAGVLVDALTRRGWSVWWDRELRHGRDFGQSIQEQLDTARCVIVLWSAASLKSAHVLEEAEEGRANGRLVPALIESVPLPLGFRRVQAADLTDWTGATAHEEYSRFEASIAALLGEAPRPAAVGQPSPNTPPPGSQRTLLIGAAIVLILSALGVGAYLSQGDAGPNGDPAKSTEAEPPAQPPIVSPGPSAPPEDTGSATGSGARGSTGSRVPTPAPSEAAARVAAGATRGPAVDRPVSAPPPAAGDKGCVSLEDSARARPEVHAVQFKLGECYYADARYDEAIAAIGRAIDINSRVPEYFRLRGLAKWKNGLGRQGLADLDSAIRLDGMNAGLYKSRGEIHVGVGDYQRAADDFYKATDLTPQDKTAWLGLADALRKNGDRESADTALRQANSK